MRSIGILESNICKTLRNSWKLMQSFNLKGESNNLVGVE